MVTPYGPGSKRDSWFKKTIFHFPFFIKGQKGTITAKPAMNETAKPPSSPRTPRLKPMTNLAYEKGVGVGDLRLRERF